MSSKLTPTALPTPPKEYDIGYMDRLVKQIALEFTKSRAVTPFTCGSDLSGEAGFPISGLTIINPPVSSTGSPPDGFPEGSVWCDTTSENSLKIITSGPYTDQDSLNLANTTDPALGDALIGFRQSNASGNLTGAVGRTVHDKLQEFVSVRDFGAVGDGTGDQTSAIQAAIDALATTGGTVFLPTGIYRTLSTINMKTGVSLKGTGYSYQYTTTDVLKGSWIKHEGSSGAAALYITDCQNLCVSDLGIFCGPIVAGNRIGIFMNSDNNPSVKHITFERICIAAANICVKWGDGLSLEQVDAITFRDFYFESCNYGFIINGANASDYSLIERGTLSNVIVAGFELATPKLLHIASCAQGGTAVTTKMFNITGGATSPVWITGCQSEGGGGYFMYAVGPNDQMQIVLENNTINQKCYFENILRVTSRNNYMNNRIELRNGVFWRSDEDRIFKSTPQAITWDVVNSSFYATTMMESDYWYGYRLPIGFQFYNLTFNAGGYLGKIIVREGVYCRPWYASTVYSLNAVAVPVVPPLGNDFYYKVTVAGTTAATEPTWPTVVGNTVTDGTVTWTCTGTAALEKSVSAILP